MGPLTLGRRCLDPERNEKLNQDSALRVFVSFAQNDSELAAQLEAALRRHSIQPFSRLGAPSREDWKRIVDQQSREADGFIFLLGPGFSATPQLQAEWRSLLRNDWDSKKPLVPVIAIRNRGLEELPPFLRNRRAIHTTDFDTAVDELQYLVQHPAEALDHRNDEKARAQRTKRLDEIKEYALALKQDLSGGEAKR